MFNLSEKVKHYFYQPKHVGTLDITQPNIFMVEITTPDGYTHMQLFVEIEHNLIKDIKFKILGCPSAIACLSFIAEYLLGKPILECKKITAEFLIKELELSKERYSVAGLVEDLTQKIL